MASTIQQVVLDHFKLRSYSYEWGSGIHQTDVTDYGSNETTGINTYHINNGWVPNANHLDFPMMISLVTLRQVDVYMELLLQRAEELQFASARAETANRIAQDMVKAVRTGNAGSTYNPTTAIYTYVTGLDANGNVQTKTYSAYDYLTNNLGITGLSNTTWDTATTEANLRNLLTKLDDLNRVSENAAIEFQSVNNLLTTANKMGVTINKLVLHGARNLAMVIGK